jgi:hypothetical protein
MGPWGPLLGGHQQVRKLPDSSEQHMLHVREMWQIGNTGGGVTSGIGWEEAAWSVEGTRDHVGCYSELSY